MKNTGFTEHQQKRIDGLKDGDTLRLVEDVSIAKPDRREKYNWQLKPVVRAGTKLTVRVEEHPFEITDEKTVVRKTIDVRPIGARGGQARLWREDLESCDGELVIRLIEASEPATMTAAEVASESGWALVSIIGALEHAGIVTAADMRRAIDEYPEDA